ncbi:M23 family metallopeptidase [Arthrobacter sp. NPDC093139]|uniref:M23 family metallopeptidase n=1 Tax=Arthrobacter sp. NPDC093139 TaxID=3363945 RepID=UPI0038246955
MTGNVSVKRPLGSAAVALAARDSARGDGAISAPAGAVLSYSRTEVLTRPKEVVRKLDAAQAQQRRPSTGTLMAPLEVLNRSSHFGLRKSPITGSAGEFHWGLDFAAACGTRVYSADAGVVRAVGWHRWGGGNRVEVDHGNGLITTYNHLEGIGVKKGQSVEAGEVIAKVGTTGASTGCHLHFETVLNGSHTDPAKWTLLPLRPSPPFADVAMTDYRKAGRTPDEPAWAVPVTKGHHHDAADHEHEAPKRTASKAKKSSTPAKAVPAPAPARTPAPAPARTPAPAPARTPAPAPARTPVPAPTKAAPKVAPAPAAPSPAPSPSAAPSSAPAPKPVPAQDVTKEPANQPLPDSEPTAVPSAAGSLAVAELPATAPATEGGATSTRP